jgi:hypothetical protein
MTKAYNLLYQLFTASVVFTTSELIPNHSLKLFSSLLLLLLLSPLPPSPGLFVLAALHALLMIKTKSSKKRPLKRSLLMGGML